jgi:hypothetical protein
MAHHQSARTVQAVRTTLSPAVVLARATEYFAQRNGIYTAFPEREGPGWATFRGQGGEEIALAAQIGPDGVTQVTGSSYLFDAQVARFLSTLPPAPPPPAPALPPAEQPAAAAGVPSRPVVTPAVAVPAVAAAPRGGA